MTARVITWGSAGACGVLLVASLGLGPVAITPGEIAQVLLGELGFGDGVDDARVRAILWHLRLPRALVAGLVGGSLALSGVILQAIFRNPMASPGVLGTTSGGAFGACLAIALGFATTSVWSLSLFAFAFALATTLLVFALATRDGRTPIATLLLCGIAVNAIASSATSLVLTLASDDWEVGRRILFWLMGGLENRTWEHVVVVAPALAVACVAAGLRTTELDLLLLGEESASALGLDAQRTKRWLLVVAAGCAGFAVSVAGMIGFVGLVVPHVVRILVGPEHRRLVGASVLCGAAFLMAMDLATRLAPFGASLRVGIVTSGIGGVFFLVLVLRQRRAVELFG